MLKNSKRSGCKSMSFWLLLLFLSGSFLADSVVFAQARPNSNVQTINGVLTDEAGTPIPGANILLLGTQTGVMSQVNGRFSIKAPLNGTLRITCLGFMTQDVKINNSTVLEVRLVEDVKAMEEVVVIGYGTVKKSDLTGSVSVVKTEEIKDVPVTRVDQMLQGRVAGAEIVSTTGEPGAGTSIRIRGTRSINASNEPLFVVDGVLDGISSLNDLNTSDIQSIEFLKDASSTAIYGSRGANGVIIISTKSGSEGKTNFTYTSNFGWSELPRHLDLMNASEFASLQNDRYFFSGGVGENWPNATKPMSAYPFPDPFSLGEGSNWTAAMIRKAPYSNHSLTASGGSKSTRFYFSGSYTDNQGIIVNSGMERYQGRLNLDHNVNAYVKTGLRINYSYIDQDVNSADIGTNTLWYRSAIFLAPTMPVYFEDGSFNNWNTQWYSGQVFDSPIANVYLKKNNQIKKSLSTNFYIELRPVKELVLRSSVSFYDYNRYDVQFTPGTMPTRALKNTGAYAYKYMFQDNNVLNENTISYSKVWNKKHNFNGMYGFTVQKQWNGSSRMSGDGYLIDAIEDNDMGAIPSKETIVLSSGASEKAMVSHLARVNYNFANTYYLTLTARADGASNFAENHKWAIFPSAALKWNLKQERFLKYNPLFSELALRLSYGVSGNQGISPYSSLFRLASSSSGYLFGGAQPVSYFPNRIANTGLTWEKTSSFNAGLDMTFLKKRVGVTVDLYSSTTTDLLLQVQEPGQTGYTSRMANIGKTSNKGIELSLNTTNMASKNFRWVTAFSISHNKQQVEDIGGEDRVIAYSNPYGANYAMYAYEKAYPLNALWGMKYAGTWKSVAEINAELAKPSGERDWVSVNTNYYQPGRQRYQDINKDGLLDNNDLVYLGDADPVIYGGLGNNFRIYGLTLNVFFNYSLGGKIYNVTETFMGTGTYLSNQYKYMTNAWHPYRNPNSDIPRADSKDDIPCDRFIHDASFLRLKDITLSYTFDLSRVTDWAKDLTLSFSGNNLYLWKKYNGYDPEVSTQSEGSTIRRMDNGAYPASRTYVFGAQLKF